MKTRSVERVADLSQVWYADRDCRILACSEVDFTAADFSAKICFPKVVPTSTWSLKNALSWEEKQMRQFTRFICLIGGIMLTVSSSIADEIDEFALGEISQSLRDITESVDSIRRALPKGAKPVSSVATAAQVGPTGDSRSRVL
jgi:hypothetical protein